MKIITRFRPILVAVIFLLLAWMAKTNSLLLINLSASILALGYFIWRESLGLRRQFNRVLDPNKNYDVLEAMTYLDIPCKGFDRICFEVLHRGKRRKVFWDRPLGDERYLHSHDTFRWRYDSSKRRPVVHIVKAAEEPQSEARAIWLPSG